MATKRDIKARRKELIRKRSLLQTEEFSFAKPKALPVRKMTDSQSGNDIFSLLVKFTFKSQYLLTTMLKLLNIIIIKIVSLI